MKRINQILTVCLTLMVISGALSSDAHGQAKLADRLDITGQIRQRTELSAKDFSSELENPRYTFLRSRLNVGVKANELIRVFVQLQDSRIWGGAGGTIAGSAPAFDAHQAFFQVEELFGSDVSAKIGRQEINIGNQRLVGAVGWHNIGRTFDAARFTYNADKYSLDLFAATLIGSTTTTNSDNLYGVLVTYPYSGGRVEVLGLFDNRTNEIGSGPDADAAMLSRLTAGAALYGAKSGVDYEIEGYFQSGDAFEAATGQLGSISSYLASAKVGYVVNEDRKLRVGGLFTLVSGDEDPTDGDIGNFNTLFATNHKFYGFMDYFIGPGRIH